MTITRSIQTVVSISLLALLLYWIDVDSLYRTIVHADLWLLALGLAIALINRVLMAMKWGLLLHAIGVTLPWIRTIRIYWVSTFLGLFLPSTVGGDVVRAYITSRNEAEPADVISSIVVERVIGLFALLSIGLVGAILAPSILGLTLPSGDRLVILILLAALALAGLVAFSLTRTCRQLIEVVGYRTARVPFAAKFASLPTKVLRSFRNYRRHPRVLAIFLFLSLLENCLPILRAFCVSSALHLDASVFFFAVVVPVVLLVVRLPVTIDGFGLREGVFMWFFVQIGISGTDGFAVSMVNHALFLLAVLPGGVMYLSDKREIHAADKPAPRRNGGHSHQ